MKPERARSLSSKKQDDQTIPRRDRFSSRQRFGGTRRLGVVTACHVPSNSSALTGSPVGARVAGARARWGGKLRLISLSDDLVITIVFESIFARLNATSNVCDSEVCWIAPCKHRLFRPSRVLAELRVYPELAELNRNPVSNQKIGKEAISIAGYPKRCLSDNPMDMALLPEKKAPRKRGFQRTSNRDAYWQAVGTY